jgi:hypothetical protein
VSFLSSSDKLGQVQDTTALAPDKTSRVLSSC